MECFESFFAPLFAAFLLRSELFDFDYHDLMKNHPSCQWITTVFMWFSAIQVFCASFLNFVPLWVRRGNRTLNKCLPTIHWIFFLLLIFGIPVAKIIIYVVALFATEIWDTIVGPWLLANCLVALFITVFWFPMVLYKEIKKAKKRLEKEQEWEKTRLEGQKQAKDVMSAFIGGLAGLGFDKEVSDPIQKKSKKEEEQGVRQKHFKKLR